MSTKGGLRQASQTAGRDAATDPLTGLGNRLALEEALLLAQESAVHGGPPPALLLLDLDGFRDLKGPLAMRPRTRS